MPADPASMEGCSPCVPARAWTVSVRKPACWQRPAAGQGSTIVTVTTSADTPACRHGRGCRPVCRTIVGVAAVGAADDAVTEAKVLGHDLTLACPRRLR